MEGNSPGGMKRMGSSIFLLFIFSGGVFLVVGQLLSFCRMNELCCIPVPIFTGHLSYKSTSHLAHLEQHFLLMKKTSKSLTSKTVLKSALENKHFRIWQFDSFWKGIALIAGVLWPMQFYLYSTKSQDTIFTVLYVYVCV